MALKTAALPKVNDKRSRIVIFTCGSKPAILAQGTKIIFFFSKCNAGIYVRFNFNVKSLAYV